MSHMLLAYRDLRDRGYHHHGALTALAREYGFDADTVSRIVRRAEDDERRNPPPKDRRR